MKEGDGSQENKEIKEGKKKGLGREVRLNSCHMFYKITDMPPTTTKLIKIYYEKKILRASPTTLNKIAT